MPRMVDVLTQVVFRVNGFGCRWEDVVAAAREWREWSRLEGDVAATTHALQSLGQDLPAEDVESAGDEFRQERDLLSAEEMEAWLERWALTADGWEKYLQRSIAQSLTTTAADVSPPSASAGANPEDVWTEAVCSGALQRWAERLATRLAVWHATAAATLEDRGAESRARPPQDQLEQTFQRFAESVVTDRALLNQIQLHQIAWTRADCTRLEFRTVDQAEEAVLQLREDRASAEAVAALAGARAERAIWFLDALEPAWSERVLSARPGECVGPLRGAESFDVLLVHEKIRPTLQDADIQLRARGALVGQAVDALVHAHVRWYWRL